MTTESSVRTVRVFLRNSPAQRSGRYSSWLSAAAVLLEQLPLSRCSVRRAYSAAFGSCVTMTIVLPCSRLSICSRPRISSAVSRSRSPVGSSQIRSVGSETMRAGDRDALLLAARELPGLVPRAVARARPASSAIAARRAPLRRGQVGQQQRQLHVPLGRQHRHQVVELEDEADVGARATARARRSRAGRCARRRRRSRPRSGVSSPPIRLSRVVLPEPDGPISATKSPCGMSRSTPCRTSIRLAAAPVGLGDAADLDQSSSATSLDRGRASVAGARPLGELHRGAVPQRLRRRQHHALAGAQARSAPGARRRRSGPSVTRRRSHLARRRTTNTTPLAPSGAHRRRPAPARRPRRRRRRRRRGCGSRKATRTPMSGTMRGSFVLERDAHLHGGLAAVGGRDDRDHLGRDPPVRVGVQHRLDRLPRLRRG